MSKRIILFTKEDCKRQTEKWKLARKYYYIVYIRPIAEKICKRINKRLCFVIIVYWATLIIIIAFHLKKG